MRTSRIMQSFIVAAAFAGSVSQDAEASRIDTNPWPIENLIDDRYYRHFVRCAIQLPKPPDDDMMRMQFTYPERLALSQCMKDENFQAIMNAKTIPDVMAADVDGDKSLGSRIIKFSSRTKLEFIATCRQKADGDKDAFRQCFSEQARGRVRDISVPLIVGGGLFFGGFASRKMWLSYCQTLR